MKILATKGKKVKHLFFTEHRAHAKMHSPNANANAHAHAHANAHANAHACICFQLS